MDKAYPPGAWKRLGEVLEGRRGQLGYGFRQREKFLADRGGSPPPVSLKTLARLERGERASYPPGTIALLEALYGYAPGSFEAVLAGGEPVPLAAASRARPSAPPPDAPVTTEAARRLFPDDYTKQLIWSLPDTTEDERAEMIDVLDGRRRGRSGGEDSLRKGTA